MYGDAAEVNGAGSPFNRVPVKIRHQDVYEGFLERNVLFLHGIVAQPLGVLDFCDAVGVGVSENILVLALDLGNFDASVVLGFKVQNLALQAVSQPS